MEISTSIREIQEFGYTVIEDFMTDHQVESARLAITEIEKNAGFGTSDFGGQRTVRSSNLIAKTRAFDDLITDTRMMSLVGGVIGVDFQLSIATIIKMYPGETPQPLHQDDSLWPAPRPHPPFVLNTIFAIDPFTCENGGTQLVPGTHKSTEPIDQQAQKVSIEMPVGSVLAWDGATWHGGGANSTKTETRCGLNINYNVAWLKQQENQFVGVPSETAAMLPQKLQELLGYKVVHQILGGVGGEDPREVLLKRAQL